MKHWPTFIHDVDGFERHITWEGALPSRSRESLVLEFKRGDIEKEKLTQRIAGMANGSGGVIVCGLAELAHGGIKYADKLVGLEHADDYKDAVQQVVDNKLRPRPTVDSIALVVRGRQLVIFNVPAHPGAVAYEDHNGGHYRLRYFVRRETHTRTMPASEVAQHMTNPNRHTQLRLRALQERTAKGVQSVTAYCSDRGVPTLTFASAEIRDFELVLTGRGPGQVEGAAHQLWLPYEALAAATVSDAGQLTIHVRGRIGWYGGWVWHPEGFK